MKIYRVILIAILFSIGITLFVAFRYTLFLRDQNYSVLTNFDQIVKRVIALELGERMAALEVENVALKEEIENLRVKVSRISPAPKVLRKVERKVKKDIDIIGNQGYLIKDGKPTF